MFNFLKISHVKAVENAYMKLFSNNFKFNKNLRKWEDRKVKDKYDHNYFVYKKKITENDLKEMENYQKEKGLNFIKVSGDKPLKLDGFQDESIYAMIYTKDKTICSLNNVEFKTPTLEELTNMELKHYGKIYGEDFTKREVAEAYNKLDYHGIYFENRLIGYCFTFSFKGYKVLDGLLINEEDRHKGFGTALLKEYCDKKTFLHADMHDTPKDMYLKMGFEIIKSSYEYLKKF